jgi:hypothetical protein
MEDWIGDIIFDPRVEAKIRTKHNVAPWEVREAVALGAADSATWEDHPNHGERLIAVGRTADGCTLIAYLKPIDRLDGRWVCLTARKIT